MKSFNYRQLGVVLLGIIAITLIVIFTPRYKIIRIDSENYITTEQTSSLYKRSKGKEEFHWDRIALYSSAAIVLCGIGIFSTRTKNG